jgi:site-specific recombinase XerD
MALAISDKREGGAMALTQAQKRKWLTSPVRAFDELVESETFLNLGRRQPVRDSWGRAYGLSTTTIRLYRSMFRKYVMWLDLSNKRLFDIGATDLELFLDSPLHLEGRRRKKLTSLIRQRYVLLLERVYKHLQAPGNLNPATVFLTKGGEKRPQLGREHDKQALTQKQVKAFMASLPEVGDTPAQWKRQRDRAMLSILVGAGLKASEVLTLKVSSVQTDPDEEGNLKIFVPRKKEGIHKEHWTVLRAFAAPEVLSWLARRRAMKIPKTLLFPASVDGARPITNMTLWRSVKQTLAAADIQLKHSGSRSLRNTFAVLELAKRTDQETVSQYLGHFEKKAILGYVRAKVRVTAPAGK